MFIFFVCVYVYMLCYVFCKVFMYMYVCVCVHIPRIASLNQSSSIIWVLGWAATTLTR